MARYTPISPASLVPGMTGTDSNWQTLVENSTRLYGESTHGGYRPTIASGTMHGADDTVLTTTGTTPAEVCRIMVPKNADNEVLRCTVTGKASSGDTARWALSYGGASGAGATTSTSEALVVIECTPTGSGHPREAILYHNGTNASDDVWTYAVSFCVIAHAAAGAGAHASGYINPDAYLYTANQPITTERVTRLLNNGRAIARERPASVYCLIEPSSWTGSRAASGVDSSTPTIVAKSDLLLVEPMPRTYRVCMYITADAGVTPKATVTVGNQEVTATATGWTQGTVTLGGNAAASMVAKVWRTAGSGSAYIKTLQIMREP